MYNSTKQVFFTTTPPSSLFSYAAFLDLPSHLDDTKMAAARHNGIKLFLKLHLHNLNPLHVLFNPITTGKERNQSLYERHVTKSGWNRAKRIKVQVSIQGLNMKYEAFMNSYQKGSRWIRGKSFDALIFRMEVPLKKVSVFF